MSGPTPSAPDPCASGRSSSGRPPAGARRFGFDPVARQLSTPVLEAAALYRRAAHALHDGDPPERCRPLLITAVGLDPAFLVAMADLAVLDARRRADMSVLGGALASMSVIRLSRWERHHLGILGSIVADPIERARALLAHHENELGPDPFARFAVTVLDGP